MRSRAVRRALECWFSMAFAPPPSQIFSPSLRTCDIRSARKRMLASNRAEVGSIFVVSRLFTWDGSGIASMRSAMDEEIGLFTVYHSRRNAQCKAGKGAEEGKISGANDATRMMLSLRHTQTA